MILLSSKKKTGRYRHPENTMKLSKVNQNSQLHEFRWLQQQHYKQGWLNCEDICPQPTALVYARWSNKPAKTSTSIFSMFDLIQTNTKIFGHIAAHI